MIGKFPVSEFNEVQAVGLLAFVADVARQELVPAFRLDDGTGLAVRLPAGLVPALALGLNSEFHKVAPAEVGSMAMQPLQVVSSQPFHLRDGSVGILLGLGPLQVPILLPQDAIDLLRKALQQAETAQTAPKPREN